MKIWLDRQRCIGTGNCTLTAPQYFTHDEDGIVHMRDDGPSDPDRATVEAAVSACPAGVISIVEGDDGERQH